MALPGVPEHPGVPHELHPPGHESLPCTEVPATTTPGRVPRFGASGVGAGDVRLVGTWKRSLGMLRGGDRGDTCHQPCSRFRVVDAALLGQGRLDGAGGACFSPPHTPSPTRL